MKDFEKFIFQNLSFGLFCSSMREMSYGLEITDFLQAMEFCKRLLRINSFLAKLKLTGEWCARNLSVFRNYYLYLL